MSATIGDDNLIGTAGNDTINLLAGADTYQGLGGADSVIGGAGADCLLGNAGADTLVGGGGGDGFALDSSGPLSGIDVVNRSSPAFADMDNDGDLDLLVAGTTYIGGTGSSALYAYRNDNGVYGAWGGSLVRTTIAISSTPYARITLTLPSASNRGTQYALSVMVPTP